MLAEWRQSTWGDEISLEYGKGIRGYSDIRGPFRVFGSNGPIGWTTESLAPGPGVILGRKGAYRGVRYSAEPFFVIDTAYYVVPKTKLDMRWLYYAIIYHKLGEIDDGSPIPSTTRSAVYVRDLEVPPLGEQRAIASTLGVLDDKIESNRRMNETLGAMGRAVFKDWFVDFGPTSAKAEERPPYLSSDIWALFPSQIDADGKPAGWEISEIGKEARCVGGSTPSTADHSLWDGGIHWATPKDLSLLMAPILLSTERTISHSGLGKISSGLLPAGTVLLSSRAPIGYLAIAEVPVAINQGFIALVPEGRLSNMFIWQWVAANMEAIVQKANGSTFQEISKSNFRPLPVVVPSDPLLKRFDEVVRPLYRKIRDNEIETHSLEELRDFLLPKLLSGQVRLQEVNEKIEGVL